MSYEFFVGFRYLRARRRDAFISLITVVSVVGVMISVITLNVALSVMTGFENDLRDRILAFSPHVVLTSYSGPVAAEPSVAESLRRLEGVKAVGPFIYVQAMVARDGAVTGVYVRGVEPEGGSDVVDIDRFMVEGSLLAMGEKHAVSIGEGDAEEHRTVHLPGTVLGAEVARQLRAGLGDVISVFSPMGSPSPVGVLPRVRRFVVVGVFDSGMFEFDGGLIYLALDDAQKLFGLGDRISGFEIRTHDLDEAFHVAQRAELQAGFPFEARDWMRMNRNVFIALRLEKFVYFLVLSLMLVVAAFSILGTLIMVVTEKRKDIAILKSMGATRKSIMRIFVLKGMVIGLAGISAGNAIALVIAWLLSKYKLPLPHGVFFAPTVPVEIVPEYFAAVSATAITICFLVTIYPAYRAARVAPVDVIRYE